MSADERNREHSDEEPQEVLISDKRHSREIKDEPEQEREDAAATSEAEVDSPPAEEPGEVVEFESPKRREAAATEPPPPADTGEDSPEAASMRMLFEAGVIPYLQGQLQLLLSFALIYLGRQPNPATGLVSTDLEQARLAIDLFVFIVERTGKHMPPEDRQNLSNVVASLRMEYAKAAPDPGAPTSGGLEEAES